MKKYIFIDESGDPAFYGYRKKPLIGTAGFHPYLILGMIETNNRARLKRSGWYVHAKDDHAEVRAKFFEVLRRLESYKAHLVVVKKDPEVFAQRHNNDPTVFYFDVLHRLLHNKLKNEKCEYTLFLAQRANNTMDHFEKTVARTGTTGKSVLEIVQSKDLPELSVVDYLIWAVQRKLMTGETRYFDALKNKYGTIVDLDGNDIK